MEDAQVMRARTGGEPGLRIGGVGWLISGDMLLVGLCGVGLVSGMVMGRLGDGWAGLAVWVFAGAAIAGGGRSALESALQLVRGTVSIDLLMVLAACGAFVLGEWPEGVFLLFLFSLSGAMERMLLGRTKRAIEALMALTPDTAVVRREGVERSIPAGEVVAGDVVVVRPSERISADGVVVRGSTSVDQSPMTGESVPVDRGEGDPVFAGTLNLQGAIEVRATRAAGETTLARMVRLVTEAQASKAPSQRFTEWFGSRYTLAVLAGSALTFMVSRLVSDESQHASFVRAITVLVVASPCAAVIAVPATILAGIARCARRGVLLKGGAQLEALATIRTVAMDKTGTLTRGEPTVVATGPAQGVAEEELLAWLAAAEARSEHPIARAIVRAASQRGIAFEPAQDMRAVVGHGLESTVRGVAVLAGKPALLQERGVAVPGAMIAGIEAERALGRTVIAVAADGRALGWVSVADELRASAREAVDLMRAMGVERVVMLTGDHEAVAGAIAAELGIEFRAGLLPEDKVRMVRGLAEGGAVAMVGDGINDGPSLAAATVGVSLGGSGTDVALEASDVVLMGDDLGKLPWAMGLARFARRVIVQNLVIALGVMGVLLALTLVHGVPMPMAVVGHEGSTVLVILNGLRLLGYRGGERGAGRVG